MHERYFDQKKEYTREVANRYWNKQNIQELLENSYIIVTQLYTFIFDLKHNS